MDLRALVLSDNLPATPAVVDPLLIDELGARLERFGDCPDWLRSFVATPEYACALRKVWLASPWIAENCVSHRDMLEDLLTSGDLLCGATELNYADQLRILTHDVADESALQRLLRIFRRREMVRIAWRDIVGWAALEETLNALSWLAEACVDQALICLDAWQRREWGTPRSADGEPQSLVVLGMGKLGAWELNYSSDIDLIFCFGEEGETDGAKPRSNGEYFNRLAQRLIRTLDERTADGYVFRVDMRLRPYGDSGPLVMNFSAMEDYYQSQGRDWERYAMIKARVIAGDRSVGAQLLKDLQPFIYRRYLDFEAFAALREMKTMIARQVSRKGLEDNVKLGAGGIREIEFIGQAFQLVRGGRQPSLRERRIQRVLPELGSLGHLPPYAVDELLAAYQFLRTVENRLQQMYDGQTHSLPDAPQDRLRLTWALGFADWAAFIAELNMHRRNVADHFQKTFAAPQAERADAAEALLDPMTALWAGHVSESEAFGILEGAGFGEPEKTWADIKAFHDMVGRRSMGARGGARLNQLMPMIIPACARTENAGATLQRLLRVLDRITGRTAYLALLLEQPLAMSQLVRLCAASAWIAEYFALHPVLLDELMDPRTLREPLSRDDLQRRLRASLDQIAADDLEQEMELLRQFKQVNSLRVAVSDVTGALPLMRVSDCLTDIAIVALQEVFRLAWQQISAKHGIPWSVHDGVRQQACFGVIAYGKLGGIELGYGSDLDVVFIHNGSGDEAVTDGERPLDNATFFARVAQRMIHLLQTYTSGGVLYQVDVRLRPSGNSGPLVSSLTAFRDYQLESAWTWEHQALVRARPVAGSDQIADGFAAIRLEVLRRPRDPEKLRNDVRDMRERMIRELASKDPALFDLKHGRGGITDIEFIVQYNVLRWASNYPELLVYPDNIRILDGLAAAELLPAADAAVLADAYRAYRAVVHRRKLQEQPAIVGIEEFEDYRREVSRIWRQIFD